MGGLLAADVALLAAGQDESNRVALEHGVLGVVGLDTTFLGMHPRIIASGLSSLFTSSSTNPNLNEPEKSEDLEPRMIEEMTNIPPHPISKTPTPTDAIDDNSALSSHFKSLTTLSPIPSATTKPKQSPWSRAFYFINKHSDDLTKASKAYLTSHLEFGGCMADYQSLKSRYERISSIESSTERTSRFVNYYTASTGRPKKKKPQPPTAAEEEARNSNDSLGSTEEDIQKLHISTSDSRSEDQSKIPSVQVINDTTSTSDSLEQQSSNNNLASISPTSPTPPLPLPLHPSRSAPCAPNLPQIPPRPSPPSPINPSLNTTKESQKLASQTHAAETKAYNIALKDRDAAILAHRKEAKKLARDGKKKAKDEERKKSTMSNDQSTLPIPEVSPSTTPIKPPKYRPFCLLPPKNAHGERDSSWVRVTMHGVDEIGAHCGLFTAGSGHYDDFVREVVDRIEGWVR